MEAKVFHSPTAQDRSVCVALQAGFGFLEQRQTRVVGFVGDVTNESPDGNPVPPARVGMEKASLDGFGQTFACSHPGGWAGKAVESPNQETAKDWQAAKKDSFGNVSGGKGCGVEKNDFFDALGPVSEGGQANGSTPIMNDELDALDFKVIQQVDDILGMPFQVISVIGEGRFVRKSASDVVGGNAAGLRSEPKNQIAIKIGPSGISVKKENGGLIALPFVQIVHGRADLGFEGFPVERVRFFDRVRCLQGLTENMMLERPLPMPRREHG